MIGITDIKRTLDGTQQPATFSEVSSPDDNSGTVAVSRPPLLEACKDQMKQRPRLGCAGIIRRGEAVLLGRRDKEPNRGLWVLPGGGVKFGESFANTLARELLEEAGIDVEVENVFKVYELINPPNEHRVIVYLIAHHRSGEPVPSSDLSEVGFFRTDELRQMSERKLISPLVERVLREATLL